MMRQIATTVLIAIAAALLPSQSIPVAAQTVKCYKKKCLEYPDGSSICQLTPVDCDQVQI
jgi:hypothetical protein